MRFFALLVLPLLAFMACEDNSEPDCRDNACQPVADAAIPDGSVINPNDDGATPTPVFDAGVPEPTPTCKGLLELCSGQECCSPNSCVNGTCR